MPFLNKTKSNFNSSKTVKSAMKQGYIPFVKGVNLYEGNWVDDLEQGFGMSSKIKEKKFTPKYKGNWYVGKRDGLGNAYYKDGSYYHGQWKSGFQSGFGKMWYSNGSFYGGNWKCGKRHGEGLFVDVNGDRYEGYWKCDVKHGIGRLYHLITGQMQEGAWLNDAAICTTIEDIPFRKTVISSTKYPIKTITLRSPNKVIYENCLDLYKDESEIELNLEILDDSFEIESMPATLDYSTPTEI